MMIDLLIKHGFDTRKQSKSCLHVLTDNDRFETIKSILELLSDHSPVYEHSMSGSSIGGIKLNNYRIIVKPKTKSNGLDVEKHAIDLLNSSLPGKIILNGKELDCIKAIKTPGTPKSDFHLVDKDNSVLMHISHKKGSKPQHFQQWAGVTEYRIINHIEVNSFILKCKNRFKAGLTNKDCFFTQIKDNHLKNMAVYGVDYDKPYKSPNKVDLVLQGIPVISNMQLTSSGHSFNLAETLPKFLDPVLMVNYRSDRNQFGINNARFSIYPAAGRKMVNIDEQSKHID